MDFTSVDRILAKLYRDVKGTTFNENDVIEMIGEAMDFLKVQAITEQAVAFIEVKNHECELPIGFQAVLQIAKNNNFSEENTECICPADVVEEIPEETTGKPVPIDCKGQPLTDYDLAYYRPFFDLQYFYNDWVTSQFYNNNYSVVRLADHTFFNSLVCKEKGMNNIYDTCRDEYTIVGNGCDRRLRFSFKEGHIALAFNKSVIDRTTGYPLIPDHISFTTAITYYIKWKVAEQLDWNGREGFARLADKAEKHWLKYARQAKNYAKMPKTLDEYQNILEQSHYLIPNNKKLYSFFGNLSQPEFRGFNNPQRFPYNISN